MRECARSETRANYHGVKTASNDETKLVKKLRWCLDEYEDLSIMFDVEDVEKAIKSLRRPKIRLTKFTLS